MTLQDESVRPNSLLWIAGWCAIWIWAVGAFLPWEGEAFDTRTYLILGGGVPLSLLGFRWLPPKWEMKVQWALTAVLVVLAVVFFRGRLSAVLAGAALLQTLLAFAFARTRPGKKLLVEVFAVALLAWCSVATLVWWKAWGDEVQTLLYPAGVLLLGIVSASAALFAPEPRPGRWCRTEIGIALVWSAMFALACSRVMVDYHDEGFLAGIIELVKQGGWLLWDVPSQYGFLNLLFASALPARNGWQAIYLANSILLFVSACLFYLRARRFFRGPFGAFYAGALAFTTVMMIPGWAPETTGPNMSPSVGAFRFLWAYVLSETVFRLPLEDTPTSGMRTRMLLLLGCFGWAIGCLWSFESAICSTAVWLPAYFWVAFKRRPFGSLRLALFLPAKALVAGAAGVGTWYLMRLGHLPDLYAYVEFLLAYQGGLGAITADWKGAVSVLLGAFVLILAMGHWIVREGGMDLVPRALSSLALFGTTCSYFVLRSHENNVTNLTPVFIYSLLTMASSLPGSVPPASRMAIRSALAPFLALAFFAALSDFSKTERYLGSLAADRGMERVDAVLPSPPPDAESLLRSAGAQPEDPFVFVGSVLYPRFSSKLWLPIAPASQFYVLSPERQAVYLERFIARVRSGGWMLVPRGLFETSERSVRMGMDPVPNPRLEILPRLARTHRVALVKDTAEWVLLKLELLESGKGAESATKF